MFRIALHDIFRVTSTGDREYLFRRGDQIPDTGIVIPTFGIPIRGSLTDDDLHQGLLVAPAYEWAVPVGLCSRPFNDDEAANLYVIEALERRMATLLCVVARTSDQVRVNTPQQNIVVATNADLAAGNRPRLILKKQEDLYYPVPAA